MSHNNQGGVDFEIGVKNESISGCKTIRQLPIQCFRISLFVATV